MSSTMLAYRNLSPELGGLRLVRTALPILQRNQVLIRVEAASLNRRDLRMVEGTYTFKFRHNTIIGADCCGEVIEIGDGVEREWLSKTVVVNPNVNWGSNYDSPGADFSILGSPHDGVFSEYVAVDKDRIALKPEHLTVEEAASLPLTGITSYRAVFTKANITANQNVLVTGVSGGVAQFVLLLCNKAGANVWVTTSDNHKLAKSVSLGAKGGVNYKTDSISQYFCGEGIAFDAIIDCAGGEQINDLLSLLKPMGRLVLYGAMNGKADAFDLFTLYYNQLQVLGTLMGNDIEFTEMLKVVNQHHIRPIIDSVFPFDRMDEAFERMKGHEHFGKIILKF